MSEIALLSKPGSNLSTSNEYQLIALLWCQGKGLERLVSKRVVYTLLCNQVVPQELVVALPGRSANDLLACVVNDVEHTLSMRQEEYFVALDIQGAYDTILFERLFKRMKEIGQSSSGIEWTKSLLKSRSARIMFESF